MSFTRKNFKKLTVFLPMFLILFSGVLSPHASAMGRKQNGDSAPAPDYPDAPMAQWEVPAKYTQDEAMSRAFVDNFDTRAEFEHRIQARKAAKASYLNLLPHVSMSSVLSLLTPSVTGLLGAVGDLAPFLLPNRWLQARHASQMSRAEAQALALMRADSAAQVEGLGYALERDIRIVARYHDLLTLAQSAQVKVQALETAGKMPDGSTDHIKATINFMILDLNALGLLVHSDRLTLAQAMGFHNPEAVMELALDPEKVTADTAMPIDTDPITKVALDRSYELAQMDELIAAARTQKREIYFNWMDPAGDYNMDLGFALGANIAIGKSRIRELQIRREQLQAMVAQKIAGAVAQYDDAILAYPVVKDGVALSARRMTRVLSQIEPNSTLNTLDVEGIFQDSISSAIRYESVLANFRVARSLVDRSLLQGKYAVLTQTDSFLP